MDRNICNKCCHLNFRGGAISCDLMALQQQTRYDDNLTIFLKDPNFTYPDNCPYSLEHIYFAEQSK